MKICERDKTMSELTTQELNDFRFGKLLNLSEDANVGQSFGVSYLSLKRLKLLWEAGFPILGLEKNCLFWVGSNYYCSPIDTQTYRLWKSIIEQIADQPPKLITAFTVESSVNEFLMTDWYSRSICCISAERELNIPKEKLKELNSKNTDDLENTLKATGREVIKLQGMFREQKEDGTFKEDPAEVSFLVISDKNEEAKKFSKEMYNLGVKYKQNSILLRDGGEERAYYLGTSEVKNPDTFAPGLGKRNDVGCLVPYRIMQYCSIPIKKRDGVLELDMNDAFAYIAYEKKELEKAGPPPKVKGDWNRISSNIYTRGKGIHTEYKWVVIKQGIKYGGIVDNFSLARNYVRLAKEGKLQHHILSKKK